MSDVMVTLYFAGMYWLICALVLSLCKKLMP